MNDLDTKALREKAGEVNKRYPAPWSLGVVVGGSFRVYDRDGWVVLALQSRELVTFIADANPHAVLRMLNEREAMLKVVFAASLVVANECETQHSYDIPKSVFEALVRSLDEYNKHTQTP